MRLQSRRTIRLGVLASVLGIAVLAAPTAQANHPDALFRTDVRAKAAKPSPPDAFMRGVESQRPGRVSLGVFERAVRTGNASPASALATTGGSFEWSEFGVGAAAGMGLVLVLGSFGMVVATTRRGSGR